MTPHLTRQELRDQIVAILDDKKAEKIVVIDLQGKSAMADFLVIASGNSGRQVNAMADTLYRDLKAGGLLPLVEGMPQCDWVLLDVGDVVVHLFKPEVRAFYNLEKMWGVQADH